MNADKPKRTFRHLWETSDNGIAHLMHRACPACCNHVQDARNTATSTGSEAAESVARHRRDGNEHGAHWQHLYDAQTDPFEEPAE